MTAADRKAHLERELGKAIRVSGRAHAKVAALCRQPRADRRSLRTLGSAFNRAALSDGRVAGFALALAAEDRRKRARVAS